MVTLPIPDDLSGWERDLTGLEEAGFDTAVVADHFTGGWAEEPFVALAAASQRCQNLRFQTNVLSVDYRHPVQVHRMATTLDRLSGGRFELGIGAGWMTSDYAMAGLRLDRPGTRIARLEEALVILEGLWGGRPFHHEGANYQVHAVEPSGDPVQQPHPPVFIGGGGPKVLALAGRRADIAGIHVNLGAGRITTEVIEEMTAARLADKVDVVHRAAESAGRDPATIELHMNSRFCVVRESRHDAARALAELARGWGVAARTLEGSPNVLVGTPAAVASKIIERRAASGISYVHFDPRPIDALTRDLLPEVISACRTEDRIEANEPGELPAATALGHR